MKINNILFLLLFGSTLIASDTFDTRFNYFANISASKLNTKGFDLNDYSHNSVDNDLSFSPYSKVGAQLSLNTENLTFTAQGLLRRKHKASEFELTWLNLKYELNDKFALRLGRIQTKVLLHSESLDIDNIQLWAKPPVEVYRLMPVRTFEGLEVTYDDNFDDYHFNISLVHLAGYKDKINGSKNTESTICLDKSHSLTFTLENEMFTYKASYSSSDADIEDDASTKNLVDILRGYGNNMDRFSYEARHVDVYSLGFEYRDDTLIFDTEIVRSETNSMLPSSTGAYMLLGYKLRSIIPYIMYAENKNDKSYYDTSDIKTIDPTSTQVKRGLDDILYLSNFSQATSSIGMRYDIQAGMAFNIQLDRITSTNYGSITSNTVAGTGYEKVGVLSRDAGVEDKAIYAFTTSLSFAY